MSQGAIIRPYKPSDFEAIKAIHDKTQIDYKFPVIDGRLFFVKEVLEVDGIVRACGAMYLQAEAYLWLDQSDWGDAEQKLCAIKALEKEVIRKTWLKGVHQAVLWLPPGMESFGKRLEEMGFQPDRDGWMSYSKFTRQDNV